MRLAAVPEGRTRARLRIGRLLLASEPPTRGELGVAAALLACLAAVVFGSNVTDGDLYIDDRWFISLHEHASGYFSAVESIYESGSYGFRPLLAAQAAATYEVLGDGPTANLVWALALAVTAAACFYALLRTLGMERLHGGAITSLALISPAADSTKLWATGGLTNTAVALYFAGATVTLRAFGATGRHARLLHGAGLLLYLLSVLMYEVAAVAMLGSVLLYRCIVPWRRAVRRWLVDVGVIGTALAINAALTDRASPALPDQLDHAQEVASNALSLVLDGGVPGGPRGMVVSVFILSLVAAASALMWRGWLADAAIRRQVRRWLVAAALAALGIAAAYLIMIPAEHDPLGPGYLNRSNLLAVFGITTFLYAVLMVGATLALRFHDRWRAASATLALAIASVLGFEYIDQVGKDKTAWAAAARVQRVEIDRLRATLPDPPAHSTVYSVGNREEVGDGLPGLIWWDLYGAGRLIWDSSVRAILIPRETTWSCERRALRPSLGYQLSDRLYETDGTYGTSFIVDVERSRLSRIDGARECRRVTGTLGAGSSVKRESSDR